MKIRQKIKKRPDLALKTFEMNFWHLCYFHTTINKRLKIHQLLSLLTPLFPIDSLPLSF